MVFGANKSKSPKKTEIEIAEIAKTIVFGSVSEITLERFSISA